MGSRDGLVYSLHTSLLSPGLVPALFSVPGLQQVDTRPLVQVGREMGEPWGCQLHGWFWGDFCRVFREGLSWGDSRTETHRKARKCVTLLS